jgi:hypothetical protein
MRNLLSLFFLTIISGAAVAQGPVLKTNWTDQVDAVAPHQEYPRPHLVRGNWQNLNGQWDYAIAAKGQEPAAIKDGKITVPFAVESLLSGVQRTVGPDSELWYAHAFDLNLTTGKNRILLHFGAVD